MSSESRETSKRISRRLFFPAMIGLGGGLNDVFKNLFRGESNIASPEIQRFCLNHQILKGDTKRRNILMTYDDWPKNPEQLESILDTYKKANAKATFFLLGDRMNWLANGELDNYGWGKDGKKLINRIVGEGHELGIHGWQHKDLMPTLTPEELSRQFDQSLNAFKSVVPNYNVRYFRSPGGDYNDTVLKTASKFGLQHVYWNVESGGTVEETSQYVKNGVEKRGNGSIVLSHVQRQYDVEQAEQIIRWLQDQSYNLTTVSEGIKEEDNRDCLNPKPSPDIKPFGSSIPS